MDPTFTSIATLLETLNLDPSTLLQLAPAGGGSPEFVTYENYLLNPELYDTESLLDELDITLPTEPDPEISVIRVLVNAAYPDNDEPDVVNLNAMLSDHPAYVDEVEDYLMLPADEKDPLDPDYTLTTGGVSSGNEGDNVMEGTIFQDSMSGNGGNDMMRGLNWADQMNGNNGNDRMWGDNGDDQMYGGAGKDRMWGGEGKDVILGEAGKDKMKGGTEDDALFGGGGKDKMWGQGGEDSLFGGNGADKLRGAAGEDALTGGKGNDKMWGGNDDDVLYLGDGVDKAYGGAGADTFIFIAGTSGIDEIWVDDEDSLEAQGFAAGAEINAIQEPGSDIVNLLIDGDVVAHVHTDGTPQDVIDLFSF